MGKRELRYRCISVAWRVVTKLGGIPATPAGFKETQLQGCRETRTRWCLFLFGLFLEMTNLVNPCPSTQRTSLWRFVGTVSEARGDHTYTGAKSHVLHSGELDVWDWLALEQQQ